MLWSLFVALTILILCPLLKKSTVTWICKDLVDICTYAADVGQIINLRNSSIACVHPLLTPQESPPPPLWVQTDVHRLQQRECFMPHLSLNFW